ncbi:sulfite dehydrogenase [Oceanithermus sp.]
MNRRTFLHGLAAALAAGSVQLVRAQQGFKPFPPAPTLGTPLQPIGTRAASEAHVVRYISNTLPSRHTGAAFAPIGELDGIITPNGLHFERDHAGVPTIDPKDYRLVLHGLVERPLMFTLNDLMRLPSENQVYFIECAGNGQNGYREPPEPALTATRSRGLVSGAEWTGVPLRILLEEAGVKPEGRWLLAEGADAAAWVRSIPTEKGLRDVLVAYKQNGEALRPEQGYPVRLVVPGWEGSIQVKWLRRILVADEPAMSRGETSEYTDVRADGRIDAFTWVMEPQSIITRPSGGQLIEPGFHQIRGLAWSGFGKVVRVEVSTDGGASWKEARLTGPVLPYALTRFVFDWNWDGKEAVLMSRVVDDQGNTQPTRAEFFERWARNNRYHYNAIQAWRVGADGRVQNGDPALAVGAAPPMQAGGCGGEVFDG